MSTEPKSEAQVIAEIVSTHLEPRLVSLDPVGGMTPKVLVTSHPGGQAVASIKKLLDEYRTQPERRNGTATLEDLDSFIAHAKRFADVDSALFANRDEPAIVSVLDYHKAGATSDPRFGQHRGRYAFPISDEWTAWKEQDGESMSQQDFAVWLEEHITEIADPAGAGENARGLAQLLGATFASPSRLLELSAGLSIRVESKLAQSTKLASGESKMVFTSTHSDDYGGELKIPSAFLVAIPVFRNGPLYQIAVRLRYRVVSGQVTWSFAMHGADRAFEHAFREACDRAADETGLPLFFGRPE